MDAATFYPTRQIKPVDFGCYTPAMGSHARNRQFIKHPTNRFSDRTIAWLVLSNFLRKIPLQLKELPNYAGHSYATVRLVATKLRRQGALTDRNQVNWTNPYVQQITPPLEELPELPRNKTQPETPFEDRRVILDTKVNEILANKTDQSPEAIQAHFATMTPERAMAILTEWIESGQAGSQLPKFIDQVMVLHDRTSSGVAPPEPVTDADIQKRLLHILDAVPRALVLSTIELWHESNRPREEAPSPPEAGEGDPILGPEPSGHLGLQSPDSETEPDPRPTLGDPPA